MSSHISAFQPSSVSVTLTTATNSVCFINTVSTVAQTLAFGATAIAVEVTNDDPINNIGVRFDGSAAVVPSNSSSLSQSHMVRPKEARYFPISVTGCSIIANGSNTQYRVTAYI